MTLSSPLEPPSLDAPRLAWLGVEVISLEPRRPVVTSRGQMPSRSGWRVTLIDSEGARGRGEASPLPGDEPLPEARAAIDRAWQLLRRAPLPRSASEVWAALAGVPGLERTPAARHGVELALLDLCSGRAGLPLASWLVGPAARAQVRTGALLLEREPAHLAAEAERAVAAGFEVLKVKVGGCALDEDARRLIALRRAVGSGPALRIDANGAWSEQEARTALGGLAPLRLELCEQPVAARSTGGLRRLRRSALCLVAADEALAGEGGVEAVLDPELGPAADVLVLKPMALGGVLRALELARRAHALGLGAYVTTSLDGAIARAAAVHLAAAIPQHALASGLATGALLEPSDEDEDDPYAPRGGRVAISTAPGLGR